MAVSKVILNGQTIMDATQTTVTVDTLVESYTALNKAGIVITGAVTDGAPLTYGNNTSDIAGAGQADYMVLGESEYLSLIGYGAVGYAMVH